MLVLISNHAPVLSLADSFRCSCALARTSSHAGPRRNSLSLALSFLNLFLLFGAFFAFPADFNAGGVVRTWKGATLVPGAQIFISVRATDGAGMTSLAASHAIRVVQTTCEAPALCLPPIVDGNSTVAQALAATTSQRAPLHTLAVLQGTICVHRRQHAAGSRRLSERCTHPHSGAGCRQAWQCGHARFIRRAAARGRGAGPGSSPLFRQVAAAMGKPWAPR